MAGVLALDFDGVVCDALEECALVTWLAVKRHDRSIPGPSHVGLLPADFTARFQKVRNYSRLLDHFAVAHLPAADGVGSQTDFDLLFTSLPSDYVSRFTTAASRARDWFRTEETEFWLGQHTLYPGLDNLLRQNSGNVAIITAKDEESVRAILRRHGLEQTVSEVFGECGRKAEAVQELCSRRGITPNSLTFIDDNLTNVRRVSAVGARARWAQWGYQTPEHRQEAKRFDVEPLELSDLPQLVV
ncbi:HAD family hydrolase [Streptomyces sp. TRM S81-3]|uniref:HAD family hydrolase n=1 Tax=Streptomyces griseicoloratus TaxID=2752516 RepID=A0A926QSF2_9ACTN|nr:HAD family hydrolase [Streptomyces griseicoloratus]MBD0421690.1 HAD family hydrolase [Streptomyces griseicoloratus]